MTAGIACISSCHQIECNGFRTYLAREQTERKIHYLRRLQLRPPFDLGSEQNRIGNSASCASEEVQLNYWKIIIEVACILLAGIKREQNISNLFFLCNKLISDHYLKTLMNFVNKGRFRNLSETELPFWPLSLLGDETKCKGARRLKLRTSMTSVKKHKDNSGFGSDFR